VIKSPIKIYGRRSKAFFQRFFGSSNFTAAGSKASGSKLADEDLDRGDLAPSR